MFTSYRLLFTSLSPFLCLSCTHTHAHKSAACRHEDSNSFWMKADGKSGSFESGELYLTFQVCLKLYLALSLCFSALPFGFAFWLSFAVCMHA